MGQIAMVHTLTVVSHEDVDATGLSISDALRAVEDTYRMEAASGSIVPVKIEMHTGRDGAFKLAMPASIPGWRQSGMKWAAFFPGNSRWGVPDSHSVIVLDDWDTGLPVAVVEGSLITNLRTAACAAVLAKFTVTRAPTTVTLVGAGMLARWTLRALVETFPAIETVRVVSRTAATRDRFCAEMREEVACELVPLGDAEQAVRGSQLIVSSTVPHPEPSLRSAWLDDDAVAVPIDGLYVWDDDLFATAGRFVTDHREFLAGQYDHRPDRIAWQDWEEIASILDGGSARQATGPTVALPTGKASIDVRLGWEVLARVAGRTVPAEPLIEGRAHAH
ncbi:ornithine cyclodeaminase family protein [Georgenia yuyongxinii]|uniref:Ornithine cyclodeaminase family protein n=1 Tax=Georgenia yuyongxinii TaxID=2589797 RepID=A0A552WY02_9MICO|nr:ornithine cyclodeaminase family protein [Georgenia yuyongxinii]TRW47556.1 ornithine cyclodeaminase family protein [Georgenia yuyongxinii]